MAVNVIGDWGCMGVDLEKFRAENQCPLYRGKWNRWIFLRTTRDNPDDATIKRTLNATLYKLNRENSDWGGLDLMIETTIPDGPRAGTRTVRVGHCDYLHTTKISRTPLDFPRELWPRLLPAKKLPARRESVDPVPTLSTKDAIWVECAFIWRGTSEAIAWPVMTESVLKTTQKCPIDADWILSSCALPPAEVAPAEKTPLEKGGTEVAHLIPPLALGGGLIAVGALAAVAALIALRR